MESETIKEEVKAAPTKPQVRKVNNNSRRRGPRGGGGGNNGNSNGNRQQAPPAQRQTHQQSSPNYANNPLGEEVEIASISLDNDDSKIDCELKKNNRGKFLKLVDNRSNGRKHRIIMSLMAAWQMCEKMGLMVEELKILPPHDPESLVTAQKNTKTLSGKPASVPAYLEGRLKSESITSENRRYYLDLKENTKARFLTLTLMTPMNRTQIYMSSSTIESVKNGVRKLLEDNCEQMEVEDHNIDLLSQMKSQAFRSDRKMFYFDVGTNFNGLFCRVSEVSRNYRTAITIPESRWTQFKGIFDEYIAVSEAFKKGGSANTTTSDLTEKMDKLHMKNGGGV